MSSLTLKLIAVITMTIDHIGAILRHLFVYHELSNMMRVVGRVAFPLFCFLIAEGMRKTKNRRRYVLWLLAFAFVSLIPYSLFSSVHLRGFHVPTAFLDFSRHNVLFTLFLGAASIYVFDLIRNLGKGKVTGVITHVLGFAAPAAGIYLANHFNTEYGGQAILVIFATYWIMSFEDKESTQRVPKDVWRFARVIPLLIWCHTYYDNGLLPYWIPFIGEGLRPFAVFAAVAVLLILVYDGTPGSAKLRGPAKIWFYIYYPAHLLVIYGWSQILRVSL